MTKTEAIKRITDWACSQVGVKESGNNSNKFALDMDVHHPNFYNGKKNGANWCAVFVHDGFVNVFGERNALQMLYLPKDKNINYGASCSWCATYYSRANALFNYPEIGDQILFGSIKEMNHTGIVVDVTKDKIKTVEGNAPDGVYLKTYNRYASGCLFGRPNWSVVDVEEKKSPWYLDELKKAVDLGITDGSRPDEPATRAESAIMALRAYKKAGEK